MNIDDLLIFLLTNLFRAYVNEKWMALFFDKGSADRNKVKAGSLLFFILTSSGYLLFRSPPVNIVTNVIGLLIMSLAYKAHKRKKVLASFLIYSVNMVCDVIVVLSFPDYGVRDISQLQGTITVLVLAVSQIILEKIIVSGRFNSHHLYPEEWMKPEFVPPHWKYLLIIPVVSIIMVHFMLVTSLFDRSTIIYEGIGLLIINIVTFVLYNTMEGIYLENMDKEVFEQQAKVYANQLDIIMKTQDQIRSLQHDMKHHVRELTAMARENHTDDILAYLKEIQMLTDNPDEFVYSGNKEIDGNLNYLIGKAHEELIDVEVSIKIPKELNFHTFDLNVILGNLIENALEAAKKTPEKRLKLDMRMDKEVLFIIVINSFDGQVNQKSDTFISRKSGDAHGQGLKNVKRILKKYNGTMNITRDNGEFKVYVMLYLTK